MKKLIIISLIFSMILPNLLFAKAEEQKPKEETNTFEKGVADANIESGKENGWKWSLIGCLGGFCLPTPLNTMGCIAATLIGYLLSPGTPQSALGQGEEYSKGFQNTYNSKVKQKRALFAFGGGAVGFLASGLIIAVSYFIILAIYGVSIFAILSGWLSFN